MIHKIHRNCNLIKNVRHSFIDNSVRLKTAQQLSIDILWDHQTNDEKMLCASLNTNK